MAKTKPARHVRIHKTKTGGNKIPSNHKTELEKHLERNHYNEATLVHIEEAVRVALCEHKKQMIKDGFFKEGNKTYVLEEREYPHDERCEGSMCWCSTRAKKRNEMIKCKDH